MTSENVTFKPAKRDTGERAATSDEANATEQASLVNFPRERERESRGVRCRVRRADKNRGKGRREVEISTSVGAIREDLATPLPTFTEK